MAIPAVILGGRIICRWLGFCITVLTISCVCEKKLLKKKRERDKNAIAYGHSTVDIGTKPS